MSDFVVDSHAIAERRCGALIKRQLPGLAALGGHYIDVEIAVVLSGEGDPFAVGRKFREQFASRIGGDAPGVSARAGRQPEVAAVHEDNLVLIDVGKAHQPAFRHFLAGSGAGEARQSTATAIS